MTSFVIIILLTGALWPLVVLLTTIVFTSAGAPNITLQKYCRNVWLAEDQKWNAWCFGDVDETISSRCGKAALNGHPWPARVVDTLVWLAVRQRNHCASCIEWDEGGNAVM